MRGATSSTRAGSYLVGVAGMAVGSLSGRCIILRRGGASGGESSRPLGTCYADVQCAVARIRVGFWWVIVSVSFSKGFSIHISTYGHCIDASCCIVRVVVLVSCSCRARTFAPPTRCLIKETERGPMSMADRVLFLLPPLRFSTSCRKKQALESTAICASRV